MKLILGGAQFGQRYGIYNKKIINFEELTRSINLAKKNKIFLKNIFFFSIKQKLFCVNHSFRLDCVDNLV